MYMSFDTSGLKAVMRKLQHYCRKNVFKCIGPSVLLVFFLQFSLPARTETVFGYEPELAYRFLFSKAKFHRAMVIGPGGYWSYVEGKPSADAAKNTALRQCRSHFRKKRQEKWGDCELIAIDGQFLWTKPPWGAPIDRPLPGPDLPLEKALFFVAEGGPPRGIVLAIHGSGTAHGESTPGPVFEGWFQLFQSLGYTVVYPSAFKGVEPVQEYYGWNTPETYPLQTKMQRIRFAQTKRTIESLKRKFPGLPLYLWSHSAGGNLSQAIEKDIAGAIIVGTSCGIGSARLSLIEPEIPVLFVYGAKDDKIFAGKSKVSRSLLEQRCGKTYFGKSRRFVIVPGEDHFPNVWDQNLLDALTGFFGARTFRLSSRPEQEPVVSLTPKAKAVFDRQYRTTPTKKAFAHSDTGFGYAGSWPRQDQADISAILECNRASTGFFYPPSGRHACVLFAVGDKIVAGSR